MTEQEFALVKDTVWKNIIDQTESLGRPPTEKEFLSAADKAKQILPILLSNIKVSDDD